MRRAVITCILLVLGGCYRSERHSPTDPEFNAALQISTNASSIPADGFSRAVITATLKPETASSKRTVAFHTTAGTFVGGTNNGADFSATADSNGIARAELQSTAKIETATVTVTAAPVTHSLTIAFVAADPATVIRLTVPAAAVPADGATVVQLHADIDAGVQPRIVQFTASVGKFPKTGALTATETAGNDGRATIDLQAPPIPSNARITASIGGFTVERFMSFVDALPDFISVSSPFNIKTTDNPVVTARLERRVGAVTKGRIVTFAAFDKDGQPIGAFFNVGRSIDDGTATATFSPGDAKPGPIRFRVTTQGADGPTITAESSANLTPP